MDFPVTIALISPNKSIVLVNIRDKFVWIKASIVVSEYSLSDDKTEVIVKVNTKDPNIMKRSINKDNIIIYKYTHPTYIL